MFCSALSLVRFDSSQEENRTVRKSSYRQTGGSVALVAWVKIRNFSGSHVRHLP